VGFLDVLQPIQIFGLKRNKRTIGGTGNSPLTIDLLNLANRETVVNSQIKAGVYTQHHGMLGICRDVTTSTDEEGTSRHLDLRTGSPANEVLQRPAGESGGTFENELSPVRNTDILRTYGIKLANARVIFRSIDQLRLGGERTARFEQRGEQYNQLIEEIAGGVSLPQPFTPIDDVDIDVARQRFDL